MGCPLLWAKRWVEDDVVEMHVNWSSVRWWSRLFTCVVMKD